MSKLSEVSVMKFRRHQAFSKIFSQVNQIGSAAFRDTSHVIIKVIYDEITFEFSILPWEVESLPLCVVSSIPSKILDKCF